MRKPALTYPVAEGGGSRTSWCLLLGFALGTLLLVACAQAPATTVDTASPAADPSTTDSEAPAERDEEPVPVDQANERISITNDESALNSRVRITSQNVPIVQAETPANQSIPGYRNQPQSAISVPGKPPVLMALNVSALAWPVGGVGNPARMATVDSEPATPGDTGRSQSQAALKVVLTLVAEVSPPLVAGQLVQATSIAIKGGFAYVSYNMRGEPFLGAVDVFDIRNPDRPKLVSEAVFMDSDIHALTFDGGKVYTAQGTGSTGFETPAAFELIMTKKGKLVLQENVRIALPSFAGTSVVVSGKNVYATSGNTGGLSVFDKKKLEFKQYVQLNDARWVDVEDGWVVVVQGTPGQVSVFDEKTLTLVNTYPFDGGDVPESKSTVQVLGEKAWIAAGTGGLQVLSILTGEVVGTVPLPLVPDLDPSVVVTNAVSVDGSLIFISNGEAGVYLAETAKKIEKTASDAPQEITLLGKLQFGDLQSVNHVEYKDKTLFVAAGSGGLKIVKVERAGKQ